MSNLLRYNWLTDACAPAVINLIRSATPLASLDIGTSPMTQTSLSSILRAVSTSPHILFYQGKSAYPQLKDAASMAITREHVHLSKEAHKQQEANIKRVYGPDTDYDAFMEHEKRWLINDKTDVRKIDSEYRNRDAELARRGLMKLDKWWDEDDDTLDQVMKGAVGPVCTKKRNITAAVGPTCSMRMQVAKA